MLFSMKCVYSETQSIQYLRKKKAKSNVFLYEVCLFWNTKLGCSVPFFVAGMHFFFCGVYPTILLTPDLNFSKGISTWTTREFTASSGPLVRPLVYSVPTSSHCCLLSKISYYNEPVCCSDLFRLDYERGLRKHCKWVLSTRYEHTVSEPLSNCRRKEQSWQQHGTRCTWGLINLF
jgi:hypothetical protein